MKKLFVYGVSVLLLLFCNVVLAEESTNIKLSYKILESQNDGNSLTMTVKLKAKNITTDPIYNLTATNIHTSNIGIDINQLLVGDINPNHTATSTESFIITIDIPISDQEEPQSVAVWSIEYTDELGNPIIEEISLR
jgi:hypothetical protein